MNIEKIEISALIPYARNARTHSDEQIAQIAGGIKEFGFNNPVLIDKDNGVIAGHGRLAAARKLNLKEVPCIRLEHLSETQRKAYILADNRIALNSGWETDLLSLELSELLEGGVSLESLGFDADEIDALLNKIEPTEGLTDEDEVPEAPPEAVTKPGDIWILGKHRLMCGDSTSVDAVDKLMDGQKADMVFTDPPYGVSYEDSKGRKIQNDELIDQKLEDFVSEAFRSGVTAAKEGAAWFVWHASRFQREFENALNAAGLNVRQQIIWVKGQGVDGTAQVKAPAIGRSHFRWLHEPCFYASVSSPFNAGDRKTTTVWTVTRQTTNTVHPTQKPVALVEIALQNSSKAGDAVLDLFGGSGSTLIAAEKNGRVSRLMELDPKYCDVIVKRWEAFTGKQATLESTGQTYSEISKESEIQNA